MLSSFTGKLSYNVLVVFMYSPFIKLSFYLCFDVYIRFKFAFLSHQVFTQYFIVFNFKKRFAIIECILAFQIDKDFFQSFFVFLTGKIS